MQPYQPADTLSDGRLVEPLGAAYGVSDTFPSSNRLVRRHTALRACRHSFRRLRPRWPPQGNRQFSLLDRRRLSPPQDRRAYLH